MKPIIFDPYHMQGLFGASVLVILISRNIFWLYFMLYSILVGFFSYVGGVTPLEIALRLAATKVAMTIAAIHYFFKTKYYLFWYVLRGILIFLIWDACKMAFGSYGVFSGTTHDTLIFAMFLPFLLRDEYLRYFSLVFLLVIFKWDGATSIVVLALQVFLLAIYKKKYWIFGVFLGAVGYLLTLGKSHLAGSRWDTWKPYVEWWSANVRSYLLGTGPGSFEWVSSSQNFAHKFIWMHTDWLQICFEYGFIGFGLFLILYLKTLWRIRKNMYLMLFWASLGVGMLTYSPLQYFTVQVMAGWVLWRAHGNNLV